MSYYDRLRQALRRPLEPKLAAAIRVMDQARTRAAALDSHSQGGHSEFGAHMLAHCPANHLPGE